MNGEVMVADIDNLLEERKRRYGEFKEHAKVSMLLKRVIEQGNSWNNMTFDKQEALHMIAHKIARIVNGDPNYKDSWTDIIGYAKRVEETLSDD